MHRTTSIPIGWTGPPTPSLLLCCCDPSFHYLHTPRQHSVALKTQLCVWALQSYSNLHSHSTVDQGLNCCVLNAHYVRFNSAILTENLPLCSVIKTCSQVHGPIQSLRIFVSQFIWMKYCKIFSYVFFMIHLVTPVAERLHDHRTMNSKGYGKKLLRYNMGLPPEICLEMLRKTLINTSRLPVSRTHRTRINDNVVCLFSCYCSQKCRLYKRPSSRGPTQYS
jgi:hypothetical protein